MPFNAPGHVLRATMGKREGAGNVSFPVFGYAENGRASYPCPVGTPNFLASAGFFGDTFPGLASPAFINNDDGDNYYAMYLPSPPWGRRGSLIRVPRAAVIVSPFFTNDDFDGEERAMNFARAVRRTVTAGVGSLLAAGVSVVFVKPKAIVPRNYSPLVGPAVLLNIANTTVAGDDFWNGYDDSTYTVDYRGAIGGDVYWCWCGGANKADFPIGYQTTTVKSVIYSPGDVGAAPPVFPPIGWFFNGTGGGEVTLPSTEVYKESSQTAINRPKLLRDEQIAVAVANRCRSFRWAWAINGYDASTGAEVPQAQTNSDPEAFVYLLSQLSPVLHISGATDNSESNGNSVGSMLLADMLSFFGA